MENREEINKTSIEYIKGGKELLKSIEPLWEKLNNHHIKKSIYFKEQFRELSFKERKRAMEKGEEKVFFITLARDIVIDKYIGYVIAHISKDNIGEVDSIYIEDEYRGLKIGDVFMKNSLEWIQETGGEKITINVAFGNEEVFKFYARYGFFPRKTTLEKI
ncbi:acetyltransferase, GNAT family [Gottschalkia acidurici 9a]|uniref:Acetyltransferase, GNAT family n=1 Tax=Gottschalkia acidurici (strain ATCC 7906 / DSM 604 / BCRC 14475 / CIP 104303 / KCTC 5404 / NCIMB 10678 / 9a) TaxID=1128398 RepID=K0AWK8_GOTA9|nr:GNAT family N-acetyltransferase [Gottschalkia acidurici]AFS78213.1 acetyltransferase, GNAT family [Gottschalkia acidurici 9a]